MIELLITLAVIGLIAWLIVAFVPLPAPFPKIIIGVAVAIAALIILRAFGIIPFHDVAVPVVR
jgi:hypothetical protein